MKSAIIVFFFLILNILKSPLSGQGGDYNYFYRVSFRDKGANSVDNYTPSNLFSQRALQRRERSGIETIDYRDLPVFFGYLNQISSLGFTLHCTSKWLNTALFKTLPPADTGTLVSLEFVADVKVVKNPVVKSQYKDKLDFTINQLNAPPFDRPITMLNGYPLHLSGFDGNQANGGKS